MSAFIYKGKAFAEPGNVQFGSGDISKIGDGTVLGSIIYLDSMIKVKLVDELPEKPENNLLYLTPYKGE